MMQHFCARCQSLQAATRIDSALPSTGRVPFALVTDGAHQQVSATCSRQLRRRSDFLDAVRFMLRARYHPASNSTTLAVARDIANRMHDSKEGHVAYGVVGMQERLRLSRSSIMKHTRVLRELGLLAFVEHGSSRRNALRTRLGDRFAPGVGFRRTATIYAPCAPPAWDRAMGRIRAGSGYTARICAVTPAGRDKATAEAQRHRRNDQRARTPSFPTVTDHRPAPVSGDRYQDSATRRTAPGATRQHKSPPGQPKRSTGVSPAEAAAGMIYAQQLRLHVWWTQGACTRQLAHALRPLIAAGFTYEESARELSRWNLRTRPANVSGYIRSELRRRANTGLLALPDGYVKPYREVPVDEAGERHARMLAQRQERFGAAFERYAQTLAGALRAAVRRAGGSPARPAAVQWVPQLREPEADFLAALPDDFRYETPREIYRRQALRHPRPAPGAHAASDADHEAMADLAEHAAAVAACNRLRAELDAWERSQLMASRHAGILPC